MEFRILGPLEISEGGRPVSIRRGKEQALLAYLLLHPNEVVPTGRLIDALWDEHPPPTASKILQNAVSHLRRQLGNGRLVTREPGYVLRIDDGELDAQEFERLARDGRNEQALSLWRGPPLPELQDERFVDDARRRLEDLRLGVLEDRIDDDLAAGRQAEVIPELERLVAEQPLRERLHGQLMRALYATGRQADALDAYRRARRTLGDELGLEPSPQLQELEHKILTQDPELAPVTVPRKRPQLPPAAGRRRLALLALAGALVLAALIVGIVEATGGESGPIVATANSLAVIDPGKNKVVGVVPIGGTPRGVTVGTQYVWATNAADGTVSQIDPKALDVVHTTGLGAAATDVVESHGQVWVATGSDNTVVRIDAHSGGVLGSLLLSNARDGTAYAIAASADRIWVGSGGDVVGIDPSTHEKVARWSHYVHAGINDVAVSGRSVWFVSSLETVGRFSAETLRQTGELGLGAIPAALTITHGSVWVAAGAPYGPRPAIWRIDPGTVRVTQTTTFGEALAIGPPTLDVASGEGAIWVAAYDAGTVVRIDPKTGYVVKTIHVGGHPSGIAAGDGKVWVTVS